ncbi:hypothetical protein BD779DRAFT_1583727 [Infundibulicybe gibba]|nr:hypothetical protein BD779DRAFT_1583727 [Infundibulicybe gibba]
MDAGRDGLHREDRSTPVRSSGAFVLSTGVYACLAVAIALYPSRFVRVAGIGALLFSLSPVVSNVATGARFKADTRNGSVAFHARRAMSMFSVSPMRRLSSGIRWILHS